MADPAVLPFGTAFPNSAIAADLEFEDNVVSLEWSPDGDQLLVLCLRGTLWIVDVTEQRSVRGLHVVEERRLGTKALWSPNGQSIAVLVGDEVHVLSARNLETKAHLSIPSSSYNLAMAWLDARTLVLPADEGLVLADIKSKSRVKFFAQAVPSASSLAVSPSGHLIAAGDEDGLIVVWDVKKKAVLRQRQHSAPAHSISWLSASTFAAASRDGTILVWTSPTSQNGFIRVLEGHTDRVTASAYLRARGLLATRSWDSTIRLWNPSTWHLESVVHVEDQTDGQFGGQVRTPIAVHPRLPLVATATQQDRVVEVLDVDRLLNSRASTDRSVHYVSAKVVLLGESGVGKTALGWRLAHNEFKEHPSTHGQQFWSLDAIKTTRPDGAECEAVLWDLAGQPDYRLVHALFVDDADLALVLVNPTDREEPLRGAEHWLQMLARGENVPSILVGARADRGDFTVARAEIERFCGERSVAKYVSTSALDGTGVDELVERIRALVDWDRMPATTTTETFKRVKDLVLSSKEDDPVFADIEDLRAKLGDGVTANDASTAVGHLAKHGYVRVLRRSNGAETVLLKPELLNNLASSYVLEARRNPYGLGALEEARVRRGDYRFPELDGLRTEDADMLLDAVTALFLRHAVCFRVQDADRIYLVFPGLINQKRPVATAAETTEFFSYVVTGAVENVYAALVVLLGYTGAFSRRDQWQNAAEYEAESGQTLGFRQVVDGEGQITLGLYAGPETSAQNRNLFKALVEKFLSGRKVDVLHIPAVRCASCDYQQDRDVVVRRLREGQDVLFCANCGTAIALPATGPVEVAASAEVTSRQRTAGLRAKVEAALVTVRRHGRAGEAPSCFVSYAWGDREDETWVETVLADDLRKAGVAVLLDRWDNAEIGANIARFAETIARSDSVVVVGTPAYLAKYENRDGHVVAAEMDLVNRRLTGTEDEKRTIRPVLRSGDEKSALPPFLHGRVTADMRTDQDYLVNLVDLVASLYGARFDHPAIAELRRDLRR